MPSNSDYIMSRAAPQVEVVQGNGWWLGTKYGVNCQIQNSGLI